MTEAAATDARGRCTRFSGLRLRRDLERWLATLGTVLLHVTNHLIGFDGEDHARSSVHCPGQIDLGHQFVDQAILFRDRCVAMLETADHAEAGIGATP